MHGLDRKRPPYAFLTNTALCFAVVMAAAASLPSPEGVALKNVAHSSRIPDAEIAAGVSLTQIANPDQTLASRIVQTTMGEDVGRITKVSLAPDGSLQSVEISLSKGLAAKRPKATIDPENLLYLPRRDTVVTRSTEAETAQLVRDGK